MGNAAAAPAAANAATGEPPQQRSTDQQLVDQARHLLTSARDGSDADVARAIESLGLLVSAIRLRDGDQAASDFLKHGRALYQQEGTDRERARVLEFLLSDESSLLSLHGRQEILSDAFSDGSSVFCRQCGGLIARTRWKDHRDQWCPALDTETAASGTTGGHHGDAMDVEWQAYT